MPEDPPLNTDSLPARARRSKGKMNRSQAPVCKSRQSLVTALVCISWFAAASSSAQPAAVGEGQAELSPRLARQQAAYQFAIAKLLAGESYYEDAQAAYERAIKLDSADPYGRVELALFHLDMAQLSRSKAKAVKHLQRAAREIGQAQRLEPDNMEVLQSYAQIHLQLAEQDPASLAKAQQAFERLRAEGAGDRRALPSLAQIYLWQRQPAKAAEVLEDAVGRLPSNRLIQSMLVDALLQAGQLGKAEAVLAENVSAGWATVEGRMQLAELLSRRGAHRAAAAALSGAQEGTERLDYRHRLARELHLSGDNHEALQRVEQLAAEQPAEAPIKRLQISILAAMARNEEALALLDSEFDEHSAVNRENVLLRSRLLERVGRNDQAAQSLIELIAKAEDEDRRLELRLMLAGVEERRGEFDRALELLQPATGETEPRRLGTLARARGELLSRHDRTRDALFEIERELSRLQTLAAGDNQQAAAVAERLGLRRLLLLSDLEEWHRLEQLASELMTSEEPAVRSAARLLAVDALAELGNLDRALDLLDPERIASAGQRQALARRVQLLDSHGRGQEARQLLSEITTAEAAVDDLFFAAQVLQQLESYAEMVPLLERAQAELPDSIRVLFLLGAAHERQGATEAAAAAFLKVLEIEPNHTASLNYLGYMWAERGEHLDQALTMVRRAVALDQDNGAYLDTLGWALYQLGDYQDARRHLEWAVRLVPNDATVFDHLGDLYVKLRQVELARGSYQRALELESEQAENVRKKLELLTQPDS